LWAQCGTLGGCATRKAKMTGGHRLKARHVIHAVGPVWNGGSNRGAELLGGVLSQVASLRGEDGVGVDRFSLNFYEGFMVFETRGVRGGGDRGR
jgi:O-acetyl-ADP-ribose deacetylase (regulator of RNase III)